MGFMSLSAEMIRESQQLVISVFKEFRNELMKSYGDIEHIAKIDGSPVTELDIKLETILKERLAAAYPEIGFQGEETESVPGTVDATWIVDPIDGTSSFVHGLPYCANMAGLVVDGIAVASVIYHFADDELFTAIRGEGAFKNGQKIQVKNTDLDNSYLFVGRFVFKYLYPVFEPYKVEIYAPIGASGYEYTRLAQGSIQGVTKLRSGSQIHDNVPGVLLVQEAGGEVISFETEDYRYDNRSFVVATPNVAQVVRENRQQIENIITNL